MSNKEKTKIWAVLILLVLGLSALSVGAVLSSQTAEEEFLVLIQKRGLTTETLRVQGYNILADYEEFVLVETTLEKHNMLLNQGYTIETLDNGDFVDLQSYAFNVKDGEPNVPSNLEISGYPNDGRGYYIIQFIGPIKMEWQEQLQDMGVRLHEFRNRYNFIVEMNLGTMRAVERLDFVNWVGIYQPAYKFEQSLLDEQGILELEVFIFDSADPFIVADRIADIGGDIHYVNADFHYLVTYIDVEKVTTLANFHNVKDIVMGPGYLSVFNADATWIAQTNQQNNRKVTDMGVTGEGELITVCDSELYGGNSDNPDHECWADPDGNPVGDNHRKIQAHYVPGDAGGDLNAGVYHGTHVTGSVLGDSPPYNTYNNNDGNAMGARVIFQDVSSDACGAVNPPSDMYNDGYGQPYDWGSRAHTNSWGGGSGYGASAVTSDQFIWDHKDFNILYAMGNSGSGANTLSSQAEGKNVLSVGAVTNSPSHNNVASFSSRGYADDGRIKPTVLHVGENLVSASQSTSGYSSMSGTSMSTPSLAGQVGQVRHYYVGGWYPSGTQSAADGFNPSNALVRATLINGAVEISGSGAYTNDNRFPNGDQGYGRSMLDRVMHFEGDARKLYVFDSWNEGVALSTGQSWSIEFEVEDASMDLEATLAWSDYPGSSGANPTIVNDLDLELFTPGGTRYVGNAFTSYNPGYSQSNPSSNPWNGPRTGEWDGLNVEENILLLPTQNGVETGVYELRVTAHQVSQGTQPFAVVVSGGITHDGPDPVVPPEIMLTRPTGGETWYADDDESITWTTTQGDGTITGVDLEYSVNNGATWNVIVTGIPDSGSHLWTVPDIDTNQARIRATVHDDNGRSDNDISGTFTIVGTPPEPPAPPENLAVEHYGTGMETLFYDDVEGGDLGYTTGTSESPASEWGIRSHGATSGVNSWDFGDGLYYKTSAYGYLSWLISPGIEIPAGAENVELSFEHWRSFGMQTTYLDGGNLKLSTTGTGGTFNLITPNEGYDGPINDAYGNPLGGQQAWGGTVGWETVTFDLSAYTGETIHLRWDAGIEAYDEDMEEGWRIDNILVTAETPGEGDEHNRLTWDASPDDPSDVAQYNVYRSEESDGTYEYVESVAADGSVSYEYIDLDKGTADDIIWWYIVRAEGLTGIEEENTYAVPEPGEEAISVDIPLYAGGDADGWNFVSFNLMPLDTTLEAILADIDGNYNKVMYFDASSGEWSSYVPGRAARYNNLHSWNHRMGIWIHMATTDTLTVGGYAPGSTDITLYPGWTMVGLPSESTGNHGLPGEIDRIGYFDASAEYNLVYNYNPGSFAFEPLRGYWIHNPGTTAVTWTVDY